MCLLPFGGFLSMCVDLLVGSYFLGLTLGWRLPQMLVLPCSYALSSLILAAHNFGMGSS